jgi:uncharacterized membrane protein
MTSPVLEQAKRPRSILAGPYGHPFHPVLITVPIGAWVASAVFDLAAALVDEPEAFATGAYWLIGLGVIAALVAALFGLLDLLTIPRGTRVFKTGLLHMALNLVVVALFVVGFAVRASGGTDEFNLAGFIISLVALAILGVSGWLGGKLAFRYGVRVADESTQREGYQRP